MLRPLYVLDESHGAHHRHYLRHDLGHPVQRRHDRCEGGDTYAVQWPLDFWYRIDHPGNYEVSISRKRRFTTLKGGIQPLDVSAKLQLKVVEGDPAQIEETLNKFRADLQSPDPEVRHNALDALATSAPSYFYEDALHLARDQDPFNVEHAVGGLGLMNTPESRAVLAEVINTRKLDGSEAEESSRCHAIEVLGMSGDTSYLAMLLPYVDHTTTCESWAAMLAIARLGKRSVVPQLQAQLRSPDPTQRLHAIEALRITTSPEAVDALIGELRDKDAGVRQKAASNLTDLTGHSVTKLNQAAPSPTQLENLWRTWWHNHRQDTTLNEYPLTICRMS
jgi:HEAT repeat protein